MNSAIMTRDICCENFKGLIAYIRNHHGREGINTLLEGLIDNPQYCVRDKFDPSILRPIQETHITDSAYWVSNEFSIALFDNVKKVVKVPDPLIEVGIGAVRESLSKRTLFAAKFMRPIAISKQVARINARFNNTKDVTLSEYQEGSVIFELKYRPGFRVTKNVCHWNLGLYQGIARVTGVTNVIAKEVRCVLNGDDHCAIKLTWDKSNWFLSLFKTVSKRLIQWIYTDLIEEYETMVQERDLLIENLNRSEKKYRELFEMESDAIFLINNVSGEIYEGNTAATKLYGYSIDELLSMRNIDLSAQPDRTTRAMNEKLTSIPVRYHRKKDGTVFPVEITANHLVWRDIQCHIASIRDITERLQAEAEKAELEAQNRQLQKADSLGRMAGAIAHHFNNQLCAVMGNLEIAMDDLPPGVILNESLTEAMQAARKAADVSGLMLTYLGQTPGKQEPIDLSETCRQSLTLLHAATPKGMILKADFPSSGPVIRADTNQMHQILTNLVTNAWEAISDSRGTIALTVKAVSHADIPTSACFPIDWRPQSIPYACLEVSDTGCGISNKDIEKLFDPFFTTKFTGRGLGLPVVMGIVKAHGGCVTVESKPGKGSIFRVFLPVSTEELPIQYDLPAITEAVQTGKVEKISKIENGGTVLLIEDDEHVRKMANKMLSHLGYTVIEAKDGAEAVEIFQQHQDEIRCVISDLTMPHMNGWDTLAALRKTSPDIPVILSSGYDEAHVMADEHPERPNAFLGKPYRLQELNNTIRQTLADKE